MIPFFEEGGYRFGVVTTRERHMQIQSLVRQMYAARGYDSHGREPNAPGDCSYKLAATLVDIAVATMTIRLDSSLGLLADNLYRNELDHLRKPGTNLCELTEFAISPNHNSATLMNGLLRLAHWIAVKGHWATDIVIEVNPRHVGYYVRHFAFSPIGEKRHCDRVNAPAMLLHRQLNTSTESAKRQSHLWNSVKVHQADQFESPGVS